MLIRVATENQGMSEVIGERLLTILACTCDSFDVINDHKLVLFSQDARYACMIIIVIVCILNCITCLHI